MTNTEFSTVVQERGRLLASRAQDYVDASLERARQSAVQAAVLVEQLQRPVKTLTTAGIRLTELSQRYAERLLSLQAELIGGTLADSAKRLRKAAKASDVRQLVGVQLDLLPATRERFAEEFKQAAELVSASGKDLRGLARDTYGALTQPAARARKPARKTTRRRTTRATKGAAAKRTRKPSRAKRASASKAAQA